MDILRFGHRLFTHYLLNRALKVTKMMLVFVWLKEQQCGSAGDTGGHQESHSAAHQEAVPAHAESRCPPQQRLPHHEALLLWWQWVCPGTVKLHCLGNTMKRHCLFSPSKSPPLTTNRRASRRANVTASGLKVWPCTSRWAKCRRPSTPWECVCRLNKDDWESFRKGTTWRRPCRFLRQISHKGRASRWGQTVLSFIKKTPVLRPSHYPVRLY